MKSTHTSALAVDIVAQLTKAVFDPSVSTQLDDIAAAMAQAGVTFADAAIQTGKFADSLKEISEVTLDMELDYIPGCWCCDPTKAH